MFSTTSTQSSLTNCKVGAFRSLLTILNSNYFYAELMCEASSSCQLWNNHCSILCIESEVSSAVMGIFSLVSCLARFRSVIISFEHDTIVSNSNHWTDHEKGCSLLRPFAEAPS